MTIITYRLRSTGLAWLCVCLCTWMSVVNAKQSAHLADDVDVTILSSNLANGATVGEWGFSVLVKVDGHCVLFDAGRYPDTVIRNTEVLDIDLSCVTDVVLSHFHFDHTTGLLPLLYHLREQNPQALRRLHVAEVFFLSRRMPAHSLDAESIQMIAIKYFPLLNAQTSLLPSLLKFWRELGWAVFTLKLLGLHPILFWLFTPIKKLSKD